MGLLKEGINEVIATTRRNAAPMGIIVRDADIRMVVFKGSHTAEHLAANKWIAANIISDPVIWVITAFDDLPATAFTSETTGGTTFDRLGAAEAWAGFRAEIERTTREALLVRLHPVCEFIIEPIMPHPVNRGFNSIIEATVHATRWTRTRDPALATLIRHHAAIVRKCGGLPEQKALSLLFSFIPDFSLEDGSEKGDKAGDENPL